MMRNLFKRLKADANGATIAEFALISPVLLMLMFGAFDIGYSLYARGVLQGAVQKAARDSGLRVNADNAAAMDAMVTDTISRVMETDGENSIVYVRRSYTSFADVGDMEDFTDSDGDNVCDRAEPFEDTNGNNIWDEKGSAGQGGARATVLYTATFRYKRIFPIHRLIGGSPFTTLVASTVLRNQPYDEEAQAEVTAGTCTTEDE